MRKPAASCRAGRATTRAFSIRIPFFAVRAKGKYLWDVDGNRYVDYWMGHTALILGHSPEIVARDIRTQATQGLLFGSPNKYRARTGAIGQGNSAVRGSGPILHDRRGSHHVCGEAREGVYQAKNRGENGGRMARVQLVPFRGRKSALRGPGRARASWATTIIL